jgi:uncharacterized protein (UPF0332 family)
VTGENRRDNANEELSRAEICLNEARALHAAAFPYGAVSRAYYAVFHASRALLFSIGLEAKRHKAVVSTMRYPSRKEERWAYHDVSRA